MRNGSHYDRNGNTKVSYWTLKAAEESARRLRALDGRRLKAYPCRWGPHTSVHNYRELHYHLGGPKPSKRVPMVTEFLCELDDREWAHLRAENHHGKIKAYHAVVKRWDAVFRRAR